MSLEKELLFSTINTIASWLVSNQIIIRELGISAADEESIVFSKPFSNQSIEIRWKFIQISGVWHYWNQRWISIQSGELVRLPINNISFFTSLDASFPRKSIVEKYKYYENKGNLVIRTLRYLALQKLPDIIFGSRLIESEIFDEGLAKLGGITFQVTNNTKSYLGLRCVDYGGIYDNNINTEYIQWPDQVPVDYYSTEYAIFVFYQLWKLTGQEKWLQSTERGLIFYLENKLPYTKIAFDCYEFKVLPIAILLHEFARDQVFKQYHSAITGSLKYEWLAYSPINVYALRLANLALLEKIGKTSKTRKAYALAMIKFNQSTQGLIRDNMGGARIRNVDLTYHQFALACLGIAIEYGCNSNVIKIFKKGLAFSDYIKLPDGHVSYFGRGCNNIYHLASYMYSRSLIGKFDNVKQIINLYSNYLSPTYGLPSALNGFRHSRVGWNHCSVPYNGQVAFFLFKTYLNLNSNIKIAGQNENITETANPDYLKLENEIVSLVISRGSDTYCWGDGSHYTGFGGLSALSVFGHSLSLAIDYSPIARRWTSDLPHSRNIRETQNLNPSLSKVEDGVKYSDRYVTAEYKIFKNSVVAKYYLFKNMGNTGENTFSLFFRADSIDRVYIRDQIATLDLAIGKQIVISWNSDVVGTIGQTEISSNPFGAGIAIEWKGKYRKGQFFEWNIRLPNE